MKKIISLIIFFAVFSSSFSYFYSPRLVHGEFEVQEEYSNAKKFDFVILLPTNWSVTYIKIYGKQPIQNEILIKDIYGKRFLTVHLKYENLTNTEIHIGIFPTSSGKIRVYEIKENGFKRVIIPIKYGSRYDLIIPILLSILPIWTFIMVNREEFLRVKRIKRRRRR